MAHMLTKEQLSRFQEAFANWDRTGEGTISAGHLCKLLDDLGENPSPELRRVFGSPDVEDERIDFDEFLTIVVRPSWSTICYEQDKSVLEAIAEFDDGSGRVPLRTFLRVVEEYMEEGGYMYTDDELVDLYRKALDMSLFEATGGSMPPSMLWKIFEEELADIRGSHRTANVESAPFNDRAPDEGESTCEMADMINVTVVDLGGKQLMVDAVASTWSVERLQQYIEEVVGLRAHRQILSLAGVDGFRHALSPSGACLSKLGVLDDSTLLLIAKDEMKLDYKQFVARLMESETQHVSSA